MSAYDKDGNMVFVVPTEKESGVSEAHERIWLQCPNTDPDNEWCGETTWCQDKINDDDVEYVRGDLVESMRQQVDQWKSSYLEQVELHNKTLDELREAEQRVKELEAKAEMDYAIIAGDNAMICGLKEELAALKAGQDGKND